MAHVLFAWELGAGYGHLHQMRVIARELLALGHRASFAVPDPDQARPVLALPDAEIHAIPMLRPEPDEAGFADSYAEVLLRCGYRDPTQIRRGLRRWTRMLEAIQPALIIADFSPLAMLAARVTGTRLATIGNGYILPPPVTPLPFTRAWALANPARLAEQEAEALSAINAALDARALGGRALGGRALDRLAALFDAEATFLCTFPELDQYEHRGPAEYWGALYETGMGLAPAWPAGDGRKVFGYLSADHPAFPAQIAALKRAGVPALLHAPGLDEAQAADLSGATLTVSAQPLHVAATLAACDIVIGQGAGLISAALIAGKPVLQLPAHLEQIMTLHRVARQGLGLGVPREAGADTILAILNRVLHEPAFTDNAGRFAAHYEGYAPALTAAAIAESCNAIVGNDILIKD